MSLAVRAKRIEPGIIEILASATCDGTALTLVGQLDPKTYRKVDDVLQAAGGRWNKKARAHVFDGLAADAIDPILLTGEIIRPQDFGQFDTPPELAADIVARANVQAGMTVLEPSVGAGNLVQAIIEAAGSGALVFGCEIDPKRHKACVSRHFRAFGSGGLRLGDFLEMPVNPVFDRVVMNPPFAKQADIAHVLHAAKFLKPGGKLVSIMSAGVMFRQDRRATEFRAFAEAHAGTMADLPPDSFKASGTSVNTVVVTLRRPA